MSLDRRTLLTAASAAGVLPLLFDGPATALTLRRLTVDEDGLSGELHVGVDVGRRTGVILLNGSDGGIPSTTDAADLARAGHTVLALAYVQDWRGRPNGLPAALSEIPLEYVFRAIRWLRDRPEVDPDRIVLVGQSRGAELALLLASVRPDVVGVVAFSPSSWVWHAVGAPAVAAWTLDGKPLPFRRTEVDEAVSPFDWFVGAPANDAARIRVEAIAAPVMLVSSRTDRVWPSADYAAEIVAARHAAGRQTRNLVFDDASHLLMGTGPAVTSISIPGTTTTFEFGGTPARTAQAKRIAWIATKRFLAEITRRTDGVG